MREISQMIPLKYKRRMMKTIIIRLLSLTVPMWYFSPVNMDSARVLSFVNQKICWLRASNALKGATHQFDGCPFSIF